MRDDSDNPNGLAGVSQTGRPRNLEFRTRTRHNTDQPKWVSERLTNFGYCHNCGGGVLCRYANIRSATCANSGHADYLSESE